MGTDVHVIVHGDPDLVDLARSEVERLEQAWSRFRPDSEVSRLNAGAGRWVDVSPDTVLLVQRSLAAHLVTSGRFDPTVLGDLLRAGYDRSFEQVVAAGDRSTAPTSDLHRGVEEIDVDAAGGRIRLAPGTGFDPGGIGKGLAADLVAERLEAEGVAGALVNLGGDLRAVGFGPAGDDWLVELDPERTGAPIATVRIERGAVATSTTARRRWTIGHEPRHHLIDPATGRPATPGVASACVLAAQGWQAEALAKALIIGGPTGPTGPTGATEHPLHLVTSVGADALVVDADGTVRTTPGFARFATPTDSAPEVLLP